MRSAPTLNCSVRYMTPCASNIQNGLNQMVIVRRATLMNRALLNYLGSLHRNGIDRRPDESPKNNKIIYGKKFLMASACTALAGGHSTLVRDFQPPNWSNDGAPWRLVRYLVDHLGNRQGKLSKQAPSTKNLQRHPFLARPSAF